MKSSMLSSRRRSLLAMTLLGLGVVASGDAASASGFDSGRKLNLTVMPTSDRTVRIALAGARQLPDEVLVRVRVVRQGNGLRRARHVRVAVVNAQGSVEHSAMRRISPAALNRRGAGYQWLMLSLPHEATTGDALVLSLVPDASS